MTGVQTCALPILTADEIISAYKKEGYAGIAVTDHFNRATVAYLGMDLSEKNVEEKFFLGARMTQKAAREQGMICYLGAEVRFDGSENDFLVYGFEPSLFADPEAVFTQGLAAFKKKCEKAGAILIQAHPFRKGCDPSSAELLDGIEVFNLNLRHESHNGKALDYAKEHDLIMTAGSDCHRPYNVCQAGIISNSLPRDTFELAQLLRSQDYLLFTKPERVEKRD